MTIETEAPSYLYALYFLAFVKRSRRPPREAQHESYFTVTVSCCHLPCRYSLPVSTFDEAIELAALLTSVGSSTLQEVIFTLAQNADVVFTAIVSSVLGQEAEQGGYYRTLQDKVPSESPFLTPAVGQLTYSWLQTFTVPGSCPNTSSIPIPITPSLTLLTIPTPVTTTLRFRYEELTAKNQTEPLFLVYLSQQNAPIVQNFTVVSTDNASTIVEAAFPFQQFKMFGLNMAMITNSSGPFESAFSVAGVTVAGPAPFGVD